MVQLSSWAALPHDDKNVVAPQVWRGSHKEPPHSCGGGGCMVQLSSWAVLPHDDKNVVAPQVSALDEEDAVLGVGDDGIEFAHEIRAEEADVIEVIHLAAAHHVGGEDLAVG